MHSLQAQENGDNKFLVESVVFIKRGDFFFLNFSNEKKVLQDFLKHFIERHW